MKLSKNTLKSLFRVWFFVTICFLFYTITLITQRFMPSRQKSFSSSAVSIEIPILPGSEWVSFNHNTTLVAHNWSDIFGVAQIAQFGKTEAAYTQPSQPVWLKIDGILVDVPVTVGTVSNGKWSLSDTSVSVIKIGEKENSGFIMYGHDWLSLLGGLKKIELGQEIEVMLADGTILKYSVKAKHAVQPKSIEKLSQNFDLLLYTCDGLLDQKRLVVIAQLI